MPQTFRFASAACLFACVLAPSAFAADAPKSDTKSAPAIPPYIAAAVSDPARPPEDLARDAARKPAQALAFSGVKPGNVVVDLVPGNGYYTRIFSKIVGAKGHVYPFVPMSNIAEDFVERDRAAMIAKGQTPAPPAQEQVLAVQDVGGYGNVDVLWEALGSYGGQFAIPQQVDLVWNVNAYHGFHTSVMNLQKHPIVMTAIDRAIFAAMKPGAVFYISDYRSATGAKFSDVETLHRIDPAPLKEELAGAGFVLDGESNLLAKPSDDHAKAVSDGSDDADRFILRFKKPANAPNADLRPGPNALAGSFGNTMEYGYDSKTPRWVRYHDDNHYQEWGINGSSAQEGIFFWDALGKGCMLHQYPLDNRSSVVCHPYVLNKKLGETWLGDNVRSIRIVPGYTYPKPEDQFACEPISCKPPKQD